MSFTSLAEEVVDYLEAAGLGTKGTDMFVQQRPMTPVDLVSVTQFGGEPPDTYLPFVEEVTVQVMCRAGSVADAEEKAYEIFEVLHGQESLVWATHGIMTILAAASPGYIGTEPLEGPDGHLWACNYTIALRRDSS